MSVAVQPPTIAAAPVVSPVGTAPAAPVVAVLKPNPSKVRLAALMFVAVYPLITAILYIVLPLTVGWPTWARTLVIAPVMVISIVFFIAPRLQRHFGWFVARLPRPRR
jgi:antibiotic biosynthesis monooxygenase (ABM) superfamily enzyme